MTQNVLLKYEHFLNFGNWSRRVVRTLLLPTDAHNVKNTELLKHFKIMLQHVSVYIETIFRELKSVFG